MFVFALLMGVLGGWEMVVLLVWPTVWGVGCALWERFRLAPRRRLSAGVPAFVSGMIAASFVFVVVIISGDGVAESALIGAVLFVMCYIPAALVFLLSRRLLRTRFAYDAPDTSKTEEIV